MGAKEKRGVERLAVTPLQRLHHLIDYSVNSLSWFPAVLNGLLTLGAAICFALVYDGEKLNSWNLVGGIVFTLGSISLTVLIDYWRRANRRAESHEAAQLRIVVMDAITPLLADLSKMPNSTPGKKQRVLTQIVGNVSSSLALFLPEAKRLRVVVYEVQSRGVRRYLTVKNTIGRNDAPREFREGDGGRGDAAFEMLSRAGSLFVGDVKKSDLPEKERSGTGYRTFISCAIAADETAYGMLSVDAPRPGDLDENDVPLVAVIASILGTAFAVAGKK